MLSLATYMSEIATNVQRIFYRNTISRGMFFQTDYIWMRNAQTVWNAQYIQIDVHLLLTRFRYTV